MEGRSRLRRWWMERMFPGPGKDRKPPAVRWQWTAMLTLFAAASVLFLARLDHALLEPEEGRYAEIPRQMLEQGRWLTPVLHGEDYWQKPPLLYWLVMASYGVFGVHDHAARLVPCLASLFTIGITTAWAWRTLGFRTGLASGVFLTLSARFLYLGGMLSMDSVLCACVLAGLAAGQVLLMEGTWRWLIASAAACGLGVLAKGPVAVVLIGVPLVIVGWVDDRARPQRPFRVLALYVAVVLLIAGPWFAFMAWRAPQAAGAFFWLHHLTRYVAPFDHEKPTWFYLPSLLLGVLPWTLLLPSACIYFSRQTLPARRRRPAALGLFLVAFLWCILFFSASGCKRQGYILPAFPLLALILGTFVTHGLSWRAPDARKIAARLTLAACVMAIALDGAAVLSGVSPRMGMSLVFASVALVMLLNVERLPTWACSAGCMIVVFGVLMCGQRLWLPAYHDRFSLRQQIAQMAEHEQEEPLPIFSLGKRWDSLSFYTQRDDIVVYGAHQMDQMAYDLDAHRRALVFLRRSSLPDLEHALPAGFVFEPRPQLPGSVSFGLIRRRR